MVFFIMSPLGAGHQITNGCDTSGKHLVDTHNSVIFYYGFVTNVHGFDCFFWLTMPVQVKAALHDSDACSLNSIQFS